MNDSETEMSSLSETEYKFETHRTDDTAVMMETNTTQTKSCWNRLKKIGRYLKLLSLIIFVSFITSVITTKHFQEPERFHNSKADVSIKTQTEGNMLPVPEMQIQTRDNGRTRIGAQLSANQTLLDDSSPRLVWSHHGGDSFLEGINHVTHYHDSHAFDCLEITVDGRYLISIQLTYRFNAVKPDKAVKSYFTLTKFKDETAYVAAKSDYMIPDPSVRSNSTVKHPIIMVRSDKLESKDLICVTASHPDLIYASQIDNFFGIVAL